MFDMDKPIEFDPGTPMDFSDNDTTASAVTDDDDDATVKPDSTTVVADANDNDNKTQKAAIVIANQRLLEWAAADPDSKFAASVREELGLDKLPGEDGKKKDTPVIDENLAGAYSDYKSDNDVLHEKVKALEDKLKLNDERMYWKEINETVSKKIQNDELLNSFSDDIKEDMHKYMMAVHTQEGGDLDKNLNASGGFLKKVKEFVLSKYIAEKKQNKVPASPSRIIGSLTKEALDDGKQKKFNRDDFASGKLKAIALQALEELNS